MATQRTHRRDGRAPDSLGRFDQVLRHNLNDLQAIVSAGKLRRRRRSTLRHNVTVGEHFSFGTHSVLWAPRELLVGNDVAVGSNVRIEVDGHIGDSVLIANSVGIVGRTDHETRAIGVSIRQARWVKDYPEDLSRPVSIGSDVWIGYGATVLSGTRIGDSSIVGAGSVVVKDIPPNAIAAGNPAVVLGWRFSPTQLEQHWRQLSGQGVRLGDAVNTISHSKIGRGHNGTPSAPELR